MSDLVARAEATLEGVIEGSWQLDPDACEADEYDNDQWCDVEGSWGGWVAHCQDLATATFIAAARTLVPELVDALKAAQQFRYQVADALGFVETVEGCGRVIVGRDDEIIEHVQHHTDTALKHEADCPVWCDDCEHYEIDRSCKRCGGSGCGPGTASGAFEPCGDCDGGCRDHANAYVYAPDIEAELKAARAQRDEFRAQLDHECAENQQLKMAIGAQLIDHATEIERLRGEAR